MNYYIEIETGNKNAITSTRVDHRQILDVSCSEALHQTATIIDKLLVLDPNLKIFSIDIYDNT